MSSPLWEILQELGENPPWLIEVPKFEYSANKGTALLTLFPLRKVGIYINLHFDRYLSNVVETVGQAESCREVHVK